MQSKFYYLCSIGNRNAERIRCFILGFHVAERLAAWNNTRYGGGL